MALPGPKSGSVKPTRMLKLNADQLEVLLSALQTHYGVRTALRGGKHNSTDPKTVTLVAVYTKLESVLMNMALGK